MKPKPYNHTPDPWVSDDNGMINTMDGTPIGQVFDNPDSGLDPLDDEESDHNKALICMAPELLKQRDELEQRLITAFIQGAAWWEYETGGHAMWATDKARALEMAHIRLASGTLGVTAEERINTAQEKHLSDKSEDQGT